MPGELRIRLFGGFHAEAGGEPVVQWHRSAALSLVKLLAVTPGHRLHRERAVDVLWPSVPSRLNKALHFARRALGGDHLLLRGDMLSLHGSPLWVDVDAFEEAARQGDIQKALGLYAGELLPENRFDAWASTRRDQMRDVVAPLLLSWADGLRARGDRRGAVAALEQLVDIDPLREEAYERLLALEERHRALRWYARIESLLREELGVGPGDALRRAHRALLTGPAPAVLAEAEERKLVTVLDADLRGEADDDPERARRDAAASTGLLGEIAERWGGTVRPRVGGGILAVFGYPAAREDHASRALWAGFEMLQRSAAPLRIGAATGEVAVVEGALDDIGGAVLDGAARLREAAAPRTLHATGRTRRAAQRGSFRFGGSRLLAASWAAEQPPTGEPPMVGRAAELRAVLGLIDEAVTSRRPRLITVAGAAGIGKSRLVREVVLEAVATRPGMRVLRGRCLAAGDGITYWPLGEILRDACGIPLSTPGPVAAERLRAAVRQWDPSTVHALAAGAAIRLPGNPLDAADPRTVADELGRAWPRFVSALATRGPLLLVIEDLHWAGAPMLAMLTRLLTRSAGPVVLLTTARPESLERESGASVVSLNALTDEAAHELVTRLPHDPARRDEILARAEGNPYFLGQLAAHVAEGGSGAALPDTLHALLSARVDGLPPAEKRLLRAASVIGRVFWTEPLRDRHDPEALASLEARGLVLARTGPGREEYAFKHALLRDVAYAALPTAQRASGHADVAAWLEEVSRERVDEVIELVAFHYAAAADNAKNDDWVRAKAFRSLIAAGVGARRRYAVAKALELHRRALRYAADPAEALEAIGDDHETAYVGDDAVSAWREAIALTHGDRRAALCLKTAQMVVTRWGGFRVPADPALGDRVIDEGLAAVSDPSTKARLLSLRALCGSRWSWTGRPDPLPVARRRQAADAACALAGRLGSPALRGVSLLGLAAVHFQEGLYSDAVLDVLEQVENDGSDRDRALAHLIACLLITDVRGDHVTALEHALLAYDGARDLSPHDRLHGTAVVMTCLEHLGRWDEIDPYLEQHLALRQGPEAEMSCPYIRSGPLVAALSLARRGEPEQARTVAATVTTDLAQPGNPEAARARLLIELGDPEAARDLALQLVARQRRPGPEEIPHEALALVESYEALADHQALREFLPTARSAAGYFASITPHCDRAEARALAAAGDHATAATLLTRAAAVFDRMSLPLQAGRTRAAANSVARPDGPSVGSPPCD
ncbi:ATP-binding protein [Paractinoplanes atraurantiacus]|uniref:Transcriptional activator domain-containing protein n=1 Tax=Paractinoplanes atraurantiacus TaxID=1036182 RepID=A0A285JZX2_9ACTN|nr:AAA family ATPase [Actinoplanes atraurantiacus]SNY65884.1 transcriptional activator domain-containing protein [Actinoplanes atraurantiacus]